MPAKIQKKKKEGRRERWKEGRMEGWKVYKTLYVYVFVFLTVDQLLRIYC